MLYHPRKVYQVLSRCTDVGKAALLQHRYPNVWIIESSLPALVVAAAAPIWKLVLQSGGLLLAGLDIASYPAHFTWQTLPGGMGLGTRLGLTDLGNKFWLVRRVIELQDRIILYNNKVNTGN